MAIDSPYMNQTSAQPVAQPRAVRWPRFEPAGTGGRAIPAQQIGTTTQASTPASFFDVRTTAHLVGWVRSAFGLNVTELARVLGVERPTVYAWLRDEAVPQQANWHRLMAIATLADRWSLLSSAPVGVRLRSPNSDGRTLVDVLAEDPIPSGLVLDILDSVAASPIPVNRPRRRGLTLIESPNSDNEMDRLTGRPMAPED